MKLDITADQYLEIEKLSLGVFAPLKSFMDKADFISCVDNMRLRDGQLFPIPIVFDLNKKSAQRFEKASNVELYFEGQYVADISPKSVYMVDKEQSCRKIFGTTDRDHPGVRYFLNLNDYFVSGDITLYKRPQFGFSEHELTPAEVREKIRKRGWKNIVGFQTRNIPHRAHEYLQKVALEHVDGILIQPIVGFKKTGDFVPQAVISAYENLIGNYFPEGRVLFAVLSTIMRYAGPREAIFHAIVRRNYGCTHFIIGRDHAGVGSFYDKYAAHQLAAHFESELGIKIMLLAGPYFCNICDGIVTEKTCPHKLTDPLECHDISGTDVRDALINGKPINPKFVRESVIESLVTIEEPFVK